MQTKLTVRVDQNWIEPAKRYARHHGTSLSRLISEYLRSLSDQDTEPLAAEAPILQRLTGILPSEASVEDYRRHLRDKHSG